MATNVELRQRAEAIIEARAEQTALELQAMSTDEIQRTLHELSVHQIELEMQNEELRRTQVELQESQARYFNLFDLAPVGYFTLNDKGLILEANLTAVQLLGDFRSALKLQPFSRFILSEDQATYYLHRRLEKLSGAPQAYDLRMVTNENAVFWGHLEVASDQDLDGSPIYRVILSDITERKRAEDALRQSEEQYRLLADNMSDAIYLMDMNLHLTFCSPSALKMRGYTFDELNALPIDQQMTADSYHRSMALLGKAMSFENLSRPDPQLTFLIEVEFSRKGGSFFWSENTYTMIRNQEGQVSSILGVGRDITERKRVEAALRKSEEQYRLLADNMTDAIALFDAKLRPIYVSPSATKLLGYSLEEFQAASLAQLMTASSLERFRALYNKALSQGNLGGTDKCLHYAIEIEYCCKDGSRFWSDNSLSLICDQTGQVTNILINGRDISKRKRIEEALTREKVLLKRAEAISHLGSWRIELATGKVSMSDEMYSLSGFDQASFSHDINDAVALMSRSEDIARLSELFLTLIQTGLVQQLEYPIKDPNGVVRWIHAHGELVRNENGQPVAIEGFAQDISERKRVEEALRESKERENQTILDEQQRRLEIETKAAVALEAKAEELARSNRELEQFANVVSHDLQEPLRMVASYTQLLSEQFKGKLDDKADRYIGYAVDGVVRMQTLISDLLSYSRVSTQAKPMVETNCAVLVREAIQDLGKAIEESGAEVIVEDLPTVLGDGTQLRQVFQNLIANALKFRAEAPPRVEITVHQDGANWEFCVADNGIGIEPKNYERVFLIFQRLHEQSKYPGSGIGLSIVKKIIERHGGRIWIESEVGNGSRFKFTLPVATREGQDS